MVKSHAYHLADLATRHRGIKRSINGETVRFPARWFRYFPRSYEPEKHALLRNHCRADAVAIDVGAHIGLFTVVMARRAERVIAFEPAPANREVLSETIRLNGLDNVEIRGEAVSDRNGEADLRLAESHTHSVLGHGRVFRVPTLALDSLDVFVSCIKIDAEGSELMILRGAQRMIENHRPAIACEVHPKLLRRSGADPMDVWLLLDDAGYELGVDRARFTEDELFEFQAVPTDSVFW